MEVLFGNFANVDLKQIVMWLIGGLLIFLAIKKDMEPTLLLPMGFGAILVNLPMSGAVGEEGALTVLTKAGIDFEKKIAEENLELCRQYGVKGAPTLILTDGASHTKFYSVPEIKKYIASL